MLYSRSFIPTLKDQPSEAESLSHSLMLKAGMIRKVAAGIYTYLPLGLRVLKKVEQVIREEMDRAGAQEILMPAVQPGELWRESGRWDFYGKELLRFKDRHGRDFCLGPTHEEVITDLVRREVRSYRQLPMTLYQIQTKFRDEVRPRSGLVRGREFGMKDAYSFDADEEGAVKSYQRMMETYYRIFRRMELDVRAVVADTGAIGGTLSHEFMVMAESGEDAIVFCSSCGYAANREMVPCAPEDRAPPAEMHLKPLEKVSTPGMRTVQEVTAYLGLTPLELVKTVVFHTESGPVGALVRGDDEVNPIKLKNLIGAVQLSLTGEAELPPMGFVGPVGINLKIMADHRVREMTNFVTGANLVDAHYVNVNHGRDFVVDSFGDLRMVRPEDPCPQCQSTLTFGRGIEVGHCFLLGTKYSHSLKATYLTERGEERELVMGCYGIGTGRSVAAAIEQCHDRDGIIFPPVIAPFQVIVLPVNPERPEIVEASFQIHDALESAGVEVLMDDREERAGTKFKDADLLGIPLRITVGERSMREGEVELRSRRTGEVIRAKVGEAPRVALDWVQEGRHWR